MNVLALQNAAPPLDAFSLTADMDVIGVWLISFLTLSVFSFLYRDNPFYKIAEHTFVGAGTAFFTLQFYQEGVLDPIVEHFKQAGERMDAGELMQLGSYELSPAWAIFWRSLAAVLGVMLLMRLFAPNSWMPRWPLATMVGIYAALKMTGETQSKFVLILKNTLKSVWESDKDLIANIGSVVLVVGLICALSHFIFTYRRTPLLAGTSRVGIIVLMITFGSMFGFTVLGRIALLIERVSELGGFSEAGYGLGGVSWLSPPILLLAMITLLLALGSLRGGDAESRGG